MCQEFQLQIMTWTTGIILVVLYCTFFDLASSGKGNRKLVWVEDFNGGTPDPAKWEVWLSPNGGGNGEQQVYTNRPSNVKCENSRLKIFARVENHGGKQFTSGRLHGKKPFKYGYFEAKAKMPKGTHLWPAIWMMPQPKPGSRNDGSNWWKYEGVYGVWPRSGEIDIMEYRGQEPTKWETNLHFGEPNKGGDIASGRKDFGVDLSKDFHTWGMEWTEKALTFYLDDKQYYQVDIGKVLSPFYKKPGQPFDQQFFWIINLAVGGNFFPGNQNVNPEEAKKWPQPVLEVDYLKVYQ